MSVSWRARDVPRPERVYYMRAAVAAGMDVSLDLRYRDKERDFPGWIRAADLGAVRVVHTSAPDGEVARTPRVIRSSDRDLYWAFVQLHGGTVVLEQSDRQVVLRQGDVGFADLTRPCRVAGSLSQMVHLVFPHGLLPLSHREAGRFAGMSLPGDRPAAGLICALTGRLVEDLDAYTGSSRARVGTVVLDAVITALADALDRGRAVPGETQRRALLLRIHAFIEERLGDPELSPSMIAAAHHISLRYLHKLFASEEATVAARVRGRRLERSRRDLLDPALHATPVSAIARRWGFTDPAHFARVFRSAYGTPPSEYRMHYGRQRPR